MKLVFQGLETPIRLSSLYVRVLEVHNRVLFTRICLSLLSGAGAEALEPYSLWDGGDGEIAPAAAFLAVSDPLRLPWDHKDLSGRLYGLMDELFQEDEELRQEIEGLGAKLGSFVNQLTHRIGGDYGFGLEWSLRQYLKAFSFRVEHGDGATYLDNLQTFLDFAADMRLKRVLLFVNLKEFLSKNEYEELLEQAFFLKLPMFLLESVPDEQEYVLERKTLIDQHFLES